MCFSNSANSSEVRGVSSPVLSSNRERNSSSVILGILREIALISLLPGFSPTTR